ncbi:low-density lipoprotein receptor class A domain-containing protein 2 [Pelodiscus sinensis]|uniref:low-density lipoprotein receptor class A domain-containing protein 2 n=1 Tax=Pelodiscus sinensis TaxID=13735 RepID=UPI003F6CBA5E
MRGHLPGLPKWLVLLNLMALEVTSIETVHLVELCGQTLRGDGLIVDSHRDSRRYYFVAPGTDCALTMQAALPRDQVQFHFRFFLVYSLPPPPPNATRAPLPSDAPRPGQRPASGACQAGSYVQFYDGRVGAAEPLGAPLCGKSIPRPVLSSGDHLTLRLVTRGQQPRVDFVGDFTSFRLGFNVSECREEPYFRCRNSKCIPRSLVCDPTGIDNCGDGSDQAAQCQGWPPAPASLQPASSPAAAVTPHATACGGAGESQPLAPDTAPRNGPAAGERSPPFLLALSILPGLAAGSALLLWCCWSPGWLVWRLGACRFLPGCNSMWASCQLCPHSCARRAPGKVGPQQSTALAV